MEENNVNNKNNLSKIIYLFILLILIIGLVVGYIFISKLDENNNTDNSSKTVTEKTNLNIEYSSEELSGKYSDYTAKIELSDDKINITGSGVKNESNSIIISKAGTYLLTGTISDCSIVIEADKSDDVVIILSNASITSKTTAPINCVKASKLTVTVQDGTVNTLTDSKTYTEFTNTEDQEPDGTLFSKSDLVINGNGKLIVNANYKDGIVSKDGLKIINTEIEVTSADDGIRGKDYLAIKDAKIKITSKEDGLKSTNDTDSELGYIVIESGNIEISSGDDGIHAEHKIVINDGTINISKSYEGIESAYIEINGGNISIIASDDGINVAGGINNNPNSNFKQNNFSSNNSNRKLVINGGTINVNSTGDGLDANGSIYISGGNITVIGPTSGGNGTLDYDSECVVTGGTIFVYGSTGMWQNPSNNSTQYTITYSKSGNSGDKIVIKDSSGNEIYSNTTKKSYQAIMLSSDKIKKGESYTLYVNDNKVSTIEANSIVNSEISGMGGNMQQGGRGFNNMNDGNIPSINQDMDQRQFNKGMKGNR